MNDINTTSKSLAAVAGLLLLASCGSLLEIPGPAPDLHNLTPKSTYNAALPSVKWQLVIEEPVAAGGLDTSRIAIRPKPTELKYFPNVRWTERAPKMIQTLLIESFENTGKIVAVGRQSIGLRSDYNLKIELREFQAEYYPSSDSPKIRVRINAKIVSQPQRAIIASHTFEQVIQSPDDPSIDDIIATFDLAAGKVFKHMVEWTLTSAIKAN